VLAFGVAVASVVGAIKSLDRAPGIAIEERLMWSGPIRDTLGRLPVQLMHGEQPGSFRWAEGKDVLIGGVDITAVTTVGMGSPGWNIELAAQPPRTAGLDRADTLISYGLVFETTGDGVGDFVVGINNDTPRPGSLRVWVTDVAAGTTREQIGPPYGFPVEFSHPDEHDGDPAEPPYVGFTFLGNSAPPGLTGASPFYAWTSLRTGKEVIAWDYAPDASWLSASAVAP
jgi:hypothetical protein